jgi:surface antigen
LRAGIITFNVALIAIVVGFFALGPRMNSEKSAALVPAVTDNDTSAASPLDQLSSATIALTVARMSNLPETTAVTNQADSEDVAVAQAATEDTTVASKPQVVTSAFQSVADIHDYTTVAGDTIASIASKFNVTSDSVRWSNNLSGANVAVGTKLQIPPVSGIIYIVGAGDNADTIAAKFNADKNKIIAFNDAELTGLKTGQRIVVPNGTKAAMVARTLTGGSSSFSLVRGSATYGYNGYDYGYCTYWVALLRAKAGNPVPTNLGNASTWAVRAAAYGLPTGTIPRVGAAVVLSTRGAGHVGYVTAVNSDGSITISEMNHIGWNRTDERTLSGSFSYVY